MKRQLIDEKSQQFYVLYRWKAYFYDRHVICFITATYTQIHSLDSIQWIVCVLWNCWQRNKMQIATCLFLLYALQYIINYQTMYLCIIEQMYLGIITFTLCHKQKLVFFVFFLLFLFISYIFMYVFFLSHILYLLCLCTIDF